MHFYPHNIPDFNNATRHLTRVERSVYRDAIERYYDTEEALPADDFNKLARILLCSTQEEKDALKLVLDEFFILTDAGHEHDRCNAEIAKYRLNSTAKAKAGKASAEARKSKRATHAEQPLNSVEQTNNYELGNNNEEIITNLKTIVPKNKFSDEDMKCAEWLFGKIREFIPDYKEPNLNGWAKNVRDMRELDKRDHKEICQLWLWCRKDSFEAANVQSPEKLRKRYDQLKTKMNTPAGSSTGYKTAAEKEAERNAYTFDLERARNF